VRNSGADFHCASIQMADRKAGPRRCGPKVPDSIRAVTDAQNDRFFLGVGERDRIVCIRTKPRISPIESSAQSAAIVIQDYIFSVDPARQCGAQNFDFRIFVATDSCVRDRYSPKHGGSEFLWFGSGVDVCGLEAHLGGDAIKRVRLRQRAQEQEKYETGHTESSHGRSGASQQNWRKTKPIPKVEILELASKQAETQWKYSGCEAGLFLVRLVARGGTMTKKEFLAELDARIAKYDLLCHPFYKAWSAGELTREDLREYGRDYFHHVQAFPAYLQEFGSRLQDDQLRRVVFMNRDDELGAESGGRSHTELWLDFVEGMGGDREANGHTPISSVSALIDSFHSIAQQGTAEEALAALYAYESQVPRVSAEKARGLRQKYGADEATCGYFILHVIADAYHSRAWRHQLTKLVEANPDSAQSALSAGENAARVLWQALDGIEAARRARNN
jgi:pyrroloquinoline-quinone synthase